MFEVLVDRADSNKASLYMPPKLCLDRSCLETGTPFKKGAMREKVGKTRFSFEFDPPGIRYGIPSTRHMDFVERSHCGESHCRDMPFISQSSCFFFTVTFTAFFVVREKKYFPFFFYSFALFLISQFKSHSRIIIRLKKLNVLQIWRFNSVIDVGEKQMI